MDITATDNCDTDVEITYSVNIIAGICTDSYVEERTWTATDNCGNSVSQTQIITITDTTDPLLNGVPSDASVECDAVPTPPVIGVDITATDNCDTDVEITYSVNIIAGICTDSYVEERTWTATDNCGNSVSQTQVLTITDTTDPLLNGVPSDASVECDAVPTPPVMGVDITATDNCDTDVEITYSVNIIAGICTDRYVEERTWTATDNCGNSVSQTQVLTITDTTDPVLSGVPADASVECDALPTPPVIGVDITATDNCDTDVEITYSVNVIAGICTDSYVEERTWTATDNCGNSVSQTQILTITDTTDPLLSGVPTDASVECDALPTPPVIGVDITATDNCDTDVEITYSVNVIAGICTDSYVEERTWTAMDNCGNSVSQTQVLTITDTTDPVLNGVPADASVECDALPTPPVIGVDITATDNCDTDVEITYSVNVIAGICTDSYVEERTWTATDNCGNSVSQTQVLTITDTTDPVLNGVPADASVECDALPTPPVIGVDITATDNCDTDVEITYSVNVIAGICTDSYVEERTWTATDNCGNSVSQTQVLTITDTTDPVLNGVPADASVECDAVPTPPVIGVDITATDNCDTDVEITYSVNVIAGICTDSYVEERTWTATDNCGNSVSQTQVLTITDTTDPLLSGVPTDASVECDAVPTPPVIGVDITATDNCDTDVEITYSVNIIAGICTDSYVEERTWTATDNCGNSVSQTQIITITDTTDPLLNGVPSDVSVECDAVPTPPVIGVDITATDNCDTDVEITYSVNVIAGICTDSYVEERTWTATDNCGNSVSQTQVLTITDTTDPLLSGVPTDVSVECDAVPTPPVIGVDITATDNCDTDVEITYSVNVIAGICTDSYVEERTWTATDNCGNSVSQTQVLTITDTTDPVLNGVPADASVECDAVPTPPVIGVDITATDNCDTDVEITYSVNVIAGICTDSYVEERTWTATDNCGNSVSQTQILTITDTTDPLLSGVPTDASVECDAVPTPPVIGVDITATDNCDTDVEITYSVNVIAGICTDSYVEERTWTATDNCGNSVSQTQVLTITDTTDPVLSGVPADASVECDALPTPPVIGVDITATDNCDTDVEITYSVNVIAGICTDSYIEERTWTATDNCGNSVSQTQVLTITDTTDPVLSGVPADASVECDAVPAPPVIGVAITATDNCDTRCRNHL